MASLKPYYRDANGLAKKPAKRKPVKGQDPKSGKFVAGNKLGVNGSGWARTRQAREIMEAYDFDPLVSRIAYHNELITEAQAIKDDLLAGFYVSMTGHKHFITSVDNETGDEIIDFQKVSWAQNRYDKLRIQADQIASQLADYVHPKLRAIETSSGDATTWAALMLAMEDTRSAAE